MKTVYELSVEDRVMLLSLLPREGNLITVRIVSELRSVIGFSAQELEDWGIKQDERGISWNPDKAAIKSCEINTAALTIFKDAVKQLDKEGKIVEQMLSIIEKLGL